MFKLSWNLVPVSPSSIYLFPIIKDTRTILYRWWLSEEGTSRNVPIAGFEMILREDYKSRDEVEGLIIFPKYHFKPQDTRNISWCSRQQSRHLLYYMAPHCHARLLHKIPVYRNHRNSQLNSIQRGFSCAQCNAYLLYCVRNKQSARDQGRSTYIWNDSIASSFCHLFAWKNFPEWKHFVVSINVPPPQLWGGQHTEMFVNHVTVFSQSVSHIRLSHTILESIILIIYSTLEQHVPHYSS